MKHRKQRGADIMHVWDSRQRVGEDRHSRSRVQAADSIRRKWSQGYHGGGACFHGVKGSVRWSDDSAAGKLKV